MSATVELGATNLPSAEEVAFGRVSQSVGVHLAETFAPQWRQIGHGLGIIYQSGALEAGEAVRGYVNHIDHGFSRLVGTVTTLAEGRWTEMREKPSTATSTNESPLTSSLLDDGVDEIIGEPAVHLASDIAHQVNSATTEIRGFTQLTAKKYHEAAIDQAAALIMEAVDVIDGQTDQFRTSGNPNPPKHDEPPGHITVVEGIVARIEDGKPFIQIRRVEKLVEPEAA